jgi:serine/threonine protein kinase
LPYAGKSIGEGTFGKVRLGIHIPTGQKVAVKTLQKEKIVEQADIERVTREICILKILRHPNIIQLYEVQHKLQRLSKRKPISISSWSMLKAENSSTTS